MVDDLKHLDEETRTGPTCSVGSTSASSNKPSCRSGTGRAYGPITARYRVRTPSRSREPREEARHSPSSSTAAESVSRGLTRLMKARCHKCGTEQELVPNPQRQLLHALPELRSPLEVVDPFACAKCGREVRLNIQFVSTDKRFALTGAPQGEPAVERRNGHVWSIDGQSAMSLNYPAVSAPGDNGLRIIEPDVVDGGGRHQKRLGPDDGTGEDHEAGLQVRGASLREGLDARAGPRQGRGAISRPSPPPFATKARRTRNNVPPNSDKPGKTRFPGR